MKEKARIVFWPVGLFILAAWIIGCENIDLHMSEAEMMYRTKCSSCHRVIEPGEYNMQEWTDYVDRHGSGLNAKEKGLVLEHLGFGE